MFMTDVNDVKIYNLSAGKSLPDWLSDQKRKALLRKDVDSRKRIELIQDFEMPGMSTQLKMSPDQQFILATGVYKPRVKCYEVNNLSIKFERCFDSEVNSFEILSEDYSKMVFMQCDRYVEFHTGHGRHYRIRIPFFGRDMSYHKPSCDLFFVGMSSEIVRLNLERGQFLQPYQSAGSSINVSVVNPEHHLICVGTKEGTVEAWDPRDRRKCGTLDVALKIPNANYTIDKLPSVTALTFKNGLQLGVGTETGQVLLYDIRSREPFLVKDHLNKAKIKRIAFNYDENIIYSLDEAIFKIWDQNNGKQIAYIESDSKFNDFATIPHSGLFFFAQDDVKMLSYYVPKLGPAPRWCSFLDNLTQEIETENVDNIYDDYKFVTRQELEELNLSDLEGTNLLRAYMHGFFIDVRLYNKAKATVQPFSYDNYQEKKVKDAIDATRKSHIEFASKLPKVNQEMALKLMEEQSSKKNKKTSNLLEDNRFKVMFENPDYEIDKNADEYKMLTPVLNRLDNSKAKELRKQAMKQFADIQEEDANKSSDEDFFSENGDSSDDEIWTKDVKKEYKKIQREKRRVEREQEARDDAGNSDDDGHNNGDFIALPTENEFKVHGVRSKINRSTLAQRLAADKNKADVKMLGGNSGNRQMTFSVERKSKDIKKRSIEMRQHREERKRLIRPITGLGLKKYIEK